MVWCKEQVSRNIPTDFNSLQIKYLSTYFQVMTVNKNKGKKKKKESTEWEEKDLDFDME